MIYSFKLLLIYIKFRFLSNFLKGQTRFFLISHRNNYSHMIIFFHTHTSTIKLDTVSKRKLRTNLIVDSGRPRSLKQEKSRWHFDHYLKLWVHSAILSSAFFDTISAIFLSALYISLNIFVVLQNAHKYVKNAQVLLNNAHYVCVCVFVCTFRWKSMSKEKIENSS